MLTQIKPTYVIQDIGAIQKLERFRNLLNMRLFPKNNTVESPVELDRELYIRIVVDLGRQIGYNERRLFRLGHEINRSFPVTLTPKRAHYIIEDVLSDDIHVFDDEDWYELLAVTDEEKEILARVNAEI